LCLPPAPALLTLGSEHGSAGGNRLRGDQYEGDDAGLGTPIDPIVDCAAMPYDRLPAFFIALH